MSKSYTVEDEKPTVIHSNEAIYEQSNGKVFLNGAAQITQGSDLIKGDAMEAQLFPNKKTANCFFAGKCLSKTIFA